MLTTYLCEFVLQEIVRYISRSLQEKKLLYFGMENLDFNFIDPVSTELRALQGDPHIPINVISDPDSATYQDIAHFLLFSLYTMNTWKGPFLITF